MKKNIEQLKLELEEERKRLDELNIELACYKISYPSTMNFDVNNDCFGQFDCNLEPPILNFNKSLFYDDLCREIYEVKQRIMKLEKKLLDKESKPAAFGE